jgi:hypothetical protein
MIALGYRFGSKDPGLILPGQSPDIIFLLTQRCLNEEVKNIAKDEGKDDR